MNNSFRNGAQTPINKVNLSKSEIFEITYTIVYDLFYDLDDYNRHYIIGDYYLKAYYPIDCYFERVWQIGVILFKDDERVNDWVTDYYYQSFAELFVGAFDLIEEIAKDITNEIWGNLNEKNLVSVINQE